MQALHDAIDLDMWMTARPPTDYTEESDSDDDWPGVVDLTPENDPDNPAFVGWKVPVKIVVYADGTQDVYYHSRDGRPDELASEERCYYFMNSASKEETK